MLTFPPPAAPLNLANSPSLHLLTPEEQTLCSALRIMPKPYLVIKETLVREYARRGGKLRRREARELVKLDVNKVSRVWDFLVQAGYLQLGSAVMVATAAAAAGGGPGAGAQNQGQAGAAAGAGAGAGAAGSSGDVRYVRLASPYSRAADNSPPPAADCPRRPR